MKNHFSIFIFLFSLACGQALIISGEGLSAELQRVRIAYASRSNSATPQVLAQSKGLF